MRIVIYHDWHNYDYCCEVYPHSEVEFLSGFTFESTESDVRLSKIQRKGLFLIELWGGDGPSRNEFHITDNENEAFQSFKEFIELCKEFADEEEAAQADKVLIETRKMLNV